MEVFILHRDTDAIGYILSVFVSVSVSVSLNAPLKAFIHTLPLVDAVTSEIESFESNVEIYLDFDKKRTQI